MIEPPKRLVLRHCSVCGKSALHNMFRHKDYAGHWCKGEPKPIDYFQRETETPDEMIRRMRD